MRPLPAPWFVIAALTAGCSAHVAPFRDGEATQITVDPMLRRGFSDETGTRVAIADFRGRPHVVTEIYTSCQVRCPMTIRALRSMAQTLEDNGVVADFVLVTLDPETDTVDRLRRFKVTHELPANFHFLTGDRETTRAISRRLGVNVAKDSGHMDHNVQIGVFNARGETTYKISGWTYDTATLLAAVR